MDDVPCAICSCSGVKEVAGRWDLEPNDTYKGLMHHQRFFFWGANYRHLVTQKNPVQLAEMIFVNKKILKSPYLDERKIEFRVMYNAIAKD